jgi:hypothetical protein
MEPLEGSTMRARIWLLTSAVALALGVAALGFAAGGPGMMGPAHRVSITSFQGYGAARGSVGELLAHARAGGERWPQRFQRSAQQALLVSSR